MDKTLRLRVLLDAMDRVTAPLRKIGSGASKASKQLKETRDRLKALERAQRDIADFRGLKASLDDTTAALAEQQRATQELGAKYRALEAPTRRQTREFEKARAAVVALKQKQQEEARQLQELRDRLQAAGVSAGGMAQAERRLRGEISRTNGEIAEQEGRLKALNAQRARVEKAKGRLGAARSAAGEITGGGAGAIGAGAALGAPVVLSAREAMGLEEGMADIRKVVEFPTPKAFDQMRSDILDLSEVLPLPAQELASIAAAAGQAGVARKDIRNFTYDAGRMAVAFDTDAKTAGEMMATWRTAFRIPQPEVLKLADQINYLGNTGPASAMRISDVVTRVGALGEVAGVSSAEIAALGSTIVGMGVNEEIAATGIKNTMLALTKGTAATKAQKKAYAELGLEAVDVAKRMQTDGGGTLLDVMKRISKLSPDKQASVLTQLFGAESVAAIAPMLTNLQLLEENLNKVGNASLYSGAMQKEFEERQKTTTNALLLAKNAASAAGTEIGYSLLPQIRAAAEWFKGVAQGVRQWTKENPGLAAGIGKVVAVIAIALTVLGGLALGISAILAPLAALQLSWVLAAPALKAFAGGLAIGAKGLLAFGAAALRAGLMLLANPITWIVLAIVAAVALLAGAAYLIIKHWGPISAWFGRLWESIKRFATGAFEFLKGLFLNFTPLGLLIKAFGPLWPWLANLGGKFASLGGQLIMGLVKGITDKLSAIKNAIVGAAKAAIGWFKDALGIKSPSRVFAGLGGYTMQGLAEGLRKGEREPLRQIQGAAGRLTRAMAVGAGILAGGAPLAAAAAPAGPGPAAAGATYNINITVPAGTSAEDIAREVRRAIEDLERDKARKTRSTYDDSDD